MWTYSREFLFFHCSNSINNFSIPTLVVVIAAYRDNVAGCVYFIYLYISSPAVAAATAIATKALHSFRARVCFHIFSPSHPILPLYISMSTRQFPLPVQNHHRIFHLRFLPSNRLPFRATQIKPTVHSIRWKALWDFLVLVTLSHWYGEFFFLLFFICRQGRGTKKTCQLFPFLPVPRAVQTVAIIYCIYNANVQVCEWVGDRGV